MKKAYAMLAVCLVFSGCRTTSVDSPEGSPGNRLYEKYLNIELKGKLPGHRGKLWSLAAGADGLFVSGGEDSRIIVWNAETMEQTAVHREHRRLVEDVTVLKNGDILSIGDDDTLRKIDGETGESEILLETGTSAFAVAPDETMLAVSSGDSSLRIYDYPGLQLKTAIGLTDGCFDIRFGKKGKTLYTGGHNGRTRQWSVKSGELLKEYEGLSGDVHCLDITADGKILAAGATNQFVSIWNTETGEQLGRYYHRDGLYDLDISRDGRIIASVGVDKVLIVAELETGRVLRRLIHEDEIHAVAIDPAGEYIVAGGYDSAVYVWGFQNLDYENLPEVTLENAGQVEELKRLNGHDRVVFDAAISGDDSVIASAGRDNKVYLWDTKSGEIVKEYAVEDTVIRLRFTNDDRYLVCKGEMGNLSVWDIESGRAIFESKNVDETISGFDLTEDDKVLVTGGRGEGLLCGILKGWYP